MSRYFLTSIVLFVLLSLSGCKPTETVTPDANDASAPQLRLGSAGLATDILIDQTTTTPEKRFAKRGDQIVFLVTATDPESGIKNIVLDVTKNKQCGDTATNQPEAQTVPAPQSNGQFPVTFAKQYNLDIAQLRGGCADISGLNFTIRASAENGAGKVTNLQPASITSFGVRVGTLNLWNPQNFPDSQFVTWGTNIGPLVDVMLLTEVRDERTARLFADAAGMANLRVYTDVAIISRMPLSNFEQHTINPPSGTLTSRESHILSGKLTVAGQPIQFVSTHYGIRDDDTRSLGAHEQSVGRKQATEKILSIIAPAPAITIVGGDLNAYSGYGPQDHDGDYDKPNATPDWVGFTWEVQELYRNDFEDGYVYLGLTKQQFCSNSRIDYILSRGPITPTRFDACSGLGGPSDHPLVTTTFESGQPPCGGPNSVCL